MWGSEQSLKLIGYENNGVIVTMPVDVVNTFGNGFSSSSLTSSYYPEFLRYKFQVENVLFVIGDL